MGEVISFTVVAISALFFVVDPIGIVPIFIAVTDGYSVERRRETARKAAILFTCILTFFVVGGSLVFQLLGVSLGAFRMAGGLLLLLTALDMLRSKQSDTRTSNKEIGEATQKEDVAVVPLAMPLLAGPGAIATVVVLAGRAESPLMLVPIFISILFTAISTYLLFRASEVVDRWLGISGRAILERIMGLLLAAIAMQFIVGGVRESFPEIFPGDGAPAMTAPAADAPPAPEVAGG